MTDIITDINAIEPNAVPGSANVDISNSSGIGLTAGSQTAGAPAGSMGTIGINAVVDQNTNTGAEGYAVYAQGNKEVGSVGDIDGAEISVVNSSGSAPQENPSNINPTGSSRGIRIGAGRTDELSGPVSVAEDIVNVGGVAGSAFNKGIVFGANSILADGQGNADAIDLAPGQDITWAGSDGSDKVLWRSDDTTGPALKIIIGNDASLNFQNAAGLNWLSFIPVGTSGCAVMTNNRTTKIF